jgi:hypothetical protein
MSSTLHRLFRGPTPEATHSTRRGKAGGVIVGLAFAAMLGRFFSTASPPRYQHPAIERPAAVDALQVPHWSKLELEMATLATGAWLAERRASQVRVRIDNPAGRIKVNMFATMQLYASAPPGAAEISASAVGMDGTSQRVYVQESDGHFTRRTVVAGSPHHGRVFVSHGITAGETVSQRAVSCWTIGLGSSARACFEG